MTYQEQYKHPSWQKKRLEVLDEHNYTCQECGNKEEQLHVHHTNYRKGNKIWEYDSLELMCLCDNCHKKYHMVIDRIKRTTGTLCFAELLRLAGYIDGLNGPPLSELSDHNYWLGYADSIRGNTTFLEYLARKI